MDLLNLQNLALGGIVAALVGFWNQFKNIARQISSLLIVQARFCHTQTPAIFRYLKTNYTAVPSGLYGYVAKSVFVTAHKRWRNIPFRVWNAFTILYGNGQILVATDGDHTITVYGLRWNFDPTELAVTAAQSFYDFEDSQSTSSMRYRIEDVVGSEKGMWASADPERPRLSKNSDTAEAIAETIMGRVDHSIDTSPMFARSEYALSHKIDPMKGLFYKPEVLEHLDDARRWFKSGDWYADRSLPWRRGWLLYGPGGTGKSSLAGVLAQTLDVPIYRYALATLSDQEFMREWQNMCTPCIALFEDFDTVFNGRVSTTEHKSLTFDCVLNQISGVSSMDGVFLVITTNCLDKIDPAMGISTNEEGLSSRPGRIDRVIYLGKTDASIRKNIVNHILPDWPEVHSELIERGDDYTPVQFQELCVQHALARLNR